MSKKVKIYCYKLAKPVVKTFKKSLDGSVGRIEYDKGFIKEHLGITYLITLDKLKKGDEIALSNNTKFLYGGSLTKKINYIPYETKGINASDGSFLVLPGKNFLTVVDPNDSCIETVILDDIVNKFFKEESEEVKEIEVNENEKDSEEIPTIENIDMGSSTEILNTEPVVTQVTIEEQVPVVSTDPLDKLINIEEDPDPSEEINEETIPMISRYSENPEEWFEESIPFVDRQESIINALEEMEARVKELEKENYRLSKKINDTVEEVKKISFLDTILFKWKTKLLNILNL